MATFEVHEIFRLSTRQEVVIAGKVVEGSVAAGMEVKFELQSRLFCSALVKGIEFIDGLAAQEPLVALVLAEQDEKDVLIYSDFCPAGTIIEVVSNA